MSGTRKSRTAFLPALVLWGVLVPLLTACALDTPSDFAQKRVELKTGLHKTVLPTEQVESRVIQTIGKHYQHYGDGSIGLVVTYDPESKSSTAMRATDNALRIATGLRKTGVREIKTEILPVKGQGGVSETIFTYNIVTAQAPAGCESMGGMDGKQTEANEDYSYGCSIEMLLAKQIARPADLKGRGGLSPADGRRQTNVLEHYRTGEPNEPLDGESATAKQ